MPSLFPYLYLFHVRLSHCSVAVNIIIMAGRSMVACRKAQEQQLKVYILITLGSFLGRGSRS